MVLPLSKRIALGINGIHWNTIRTIGKAILVLVPIFFSLFGHNLQDFLLYIVTECYDFGYLGTLGE